MGFESAEQVSSIPVFLLPLDSLFLFFFFFLSPFCLNSPSLVCVLLPPLLLHLDASPGAAPTRRGDSAVTLRAHSHGTASTEPGASSAGKKGWEGRKRGGGGLCLGLGGGCLYFVMRNRTAWRWLRTTVCSAPSRPCVPAALVLGQILVVGVLGGGGAQSCGPALLLEQCLPVPCMQKL